MPPIFVAETPRIALTLPTKSVDIIVGAAAASAGKLAEVGKKSDNTRVIPSATAKTRRSSLFLFIVMKL